MKNKYFNPLLFLGIYELFYSIKLLWNLAYGRMNSILIAGQILSGFPANMIFLIIGLSGLCLGYGIIKLKRWSYYGFIALNGALLLMFLSNLFIISAQDHIRPVLLHKSVVVAGLLLFIWYFRKQFKVKERLTPSSS
jgi:hypothetical protein